jgi:hypothetical protein
LKLREEQVEYFQGGNSHHGGQIISLALYVQQLPETEIKAKGKTGRRCCRYQSAYGLAANTRNLANSYAKKQAKIGRRGVIREGRRASLE